MVSLDDVSEVSRVEVCGEQFSVVRAVLDLRISAIFGEKTEWSPDFCSMTALTDTLDASVLRHNWIEPMIGWVTSAISNVHEKIRLRPRSKCGVL